MTEEHVYCSAVPRTFAQDCRKAIFSINNVAHQEEERKIRISNFWPKSWTKLQKCIFRNFLISMFFRLGKIYTKNVAKHFFDHFDGKSQGEEISKL